MSTTLKLLVPNAKISITGGPTARLAWARARARHLWALKAKYTSTGGEGTGEGARGTGTRACYLDFVSCPGLSNFLGPPLISIKYKKKKCTQCIQIHRKQQRTPTFRQKVAGNSFNHNI
jgi:hypothetical protein